MRWVICAVVMLALMPRAFADDLDILRGPQPVGPVAFTRWSGFYVGGQAGYSSDTADFSKTTEPPLAYALRDTALESAFSPSQWLQLGQGSASGMSYGGFAGYNSQWQDLILGFEADYTRVSLSSVATGTPISRQVSTVDSNTTEVTSYDVTANGSGSLRLIDYASLRARAGWVLDSILPYGFVGFVVGRGDYTRSSVVSWQQNTALPPAVPVLPCDPATSATCLDFSVPSSDGETSVLMYGFSVGGGFDVALTSNIFLRGEFEYVRFAPLADILVSVASARAGAGIKF